MDYRTKVSIVSWNGQDTFVIAGDGEGNHGVHLGTGVDGIYDLPLAPLFTEYAFQHGASYGGTRYPPRRFSFGVVIYGEAGIGWDRRDSRWRRAWSTAADSTMVIETPHSRRYLKLRLAEAPTLVTESDPNQTQVERIVMPVIALDPFWYGDERSFMWANPTDTTGVPPASITLSDIMLDNPGDFPMWPIYELQAHAGAQWILPDYSWGSKRWRSAVQHAARMLTMPALIEGEHLLVDTNEQAKLGQFESSLDTQFYKRMQGKRFLYPVPEGTVPAGPNAKIGVANAPQGLSVRIRLVRPWTRPWGMEVDD